MKKFALDDRLHNYQAQAIGADNLDFYNIVGITEDLYVFALAVLSELGISSEGLSIGARNEAPKQQQHFDITPEFRSQFEQAHAADYELYEDAKKRSARLKAEQARRTIAP